MQDTKMSLQSIIEYMGQLDLAIMKSAENNLGEIDEALSQELVKIEDRLPDKIDGYGFILEALESRREFWKARLNKIKNVVTCIDHHEENLKRSLVLAMQTLQVNKLEGIESYFKLIQSKKKVIIDDESLIPPGYKEVIQTFKTKKDAIYEDLSAGIPVPGARLEESSYVRNYLKGK